MNENFLFKEIQITIFPSKILSSKNHKTVEHTSPLRVTLSLFLSTAK